MTYRYFELIDDVGQDFYRADEDGNVEGWNVVLECWEKSFISDLNTLEWVGQASFILKFEEVTEDDVR